MNITMNKKTEKILEKCTKISRKISILAVVFFISFALISLLANYLEHIESSWILIETTAKILLIFTLVTVLISWLTPGIFIILFHPEVSHAWLQGIRPSFSKKDWDQQSNIEKAYTYFISLLLFGFTIFGIVALIINEI